MRLRRLSANGWLLVCSAVILGSLVGEQAFRSITGRKAGSLIEHEREVAEAQKYAMGPAVGDPAPPLSLKSYQGGRMVNLADFRGRHVLVSFYCGCYLCEDVAKEFERLQKKRPKHRPAMIGICSFTEDRLEPFLKDSGARGATYLHDPGKKASTRWGSRVCPRTWLVDEKGRIAYRHEEPEGAMHPSPVPAQVWNRLDHPKALRTAAR